MRPLRLAFDTSVLVAALVEPHPLHSRALPWLEAVTTHAVAGECSWHAVAETWSVLTRLPLEPPVSPALAALAVERLMTVLEVRELTGEVYRAAIRRCAERGVRSGALFDALHLVCAEASGADALVTFNRGDFVRLAVEPGPAILVPPDPPQVALPEG